jgi:hypothetical protein
VYDRTTTRLVEQNIPTAQILARIAERADDDGDQDTSGRP